MNSRPDGGAETRDLSAAAGLEDVPQGAFALAGAAVGLLLACWLLVYFLVFLPRGPVG